MTRTTHRSTAGTKLYAKRTKGQFTDIQTHRRSSRADQRVTTVEEATRVLVAACRAWCRMQSRTFFADRKPSMEMQLVEAIANLNTATRSAAKRKRGKA